MEYDPKTMFFHFTKDTLHDGSPIPKKGEWLIFEGKPKLCERGLHASRHPMDALRYAPGNLLHIVNLGEIVEEQSDKVVSDKRRIIATIDAESVLRKAACKFASDVLPLWQAPPIVKKYLLTQDPDIRDAARYAAWDAARDSARYAAWDAARDSARYAAWDAARDAARDAAWDAARDAAWAAARYAARYAARDAAWDAAWDAARDAARYAARDAARYAARDAARDAQRDYLLKQILLEFGVKING